MNNKLETHNLFTETLYAAEIKIDETIISKILKLPETIVTDHKSNEGGWQSPIQKIDSIDFLKPLMESCRNNCIHLFEEYGIENTNKFCYWININYPGNYNVRHRHVGFMSGCLYLKVPENSGDFVIHKNNLFTARIKTLTKYTIPTFSITPTPGLLIVFPMYLEHEVTVNNSGEPRISIAFNIE